MQRDPDSWLLVEADTAGREHFDPDHARRYDAKMDAQAARELEVLASYGAVGPERTIVEFGAGTGQFAAAAASRYRRVVAVDVSAVMLEQLRLKVADQGLSNVDVQQAGFLTYSHREDPADVIYSRYALHHLPDFWKAIALQRVVDMLRPGGVFRLWDVIFGFAPKEADDRLEAVMAQFTVADPADGWTRAEMAEHVREEHSTFTWLLEPMLERVGFEILDADYSDDLVDAKYLCRKP